MVCFVFIAIILAGPIGCKPETSVDGSIGEAQTHIHAGRVREGASILRDVVADAPDHTYARWLFAELHAQLGDWPAAEKEYRQALALGMSPNAAYAPYALSLLMQGQTDAVLALREGSDLSPDAAAALASVKALAALDKGDRSKAEVQLATARRLGNGGVPAAIAEVRLLAASGDLPAARAALDDALARHPDSAWGWHLCGELAKAAGDAPRAAQCYAVAVELGPWTPRWLFDHALGLIDQGRLDEAEPHLDRMLAVSPKTSPTNFAVGRYLLARGQPETARGFFELALLAKPDHAETLYYLGAVQLGLGSHGAAEGYLRKVLDLAPQAYGARKLLADRQLEQRAFAEAARLLLPAFAEGQVDADGLVLYAGALIGLGEPVAAVAAMRDAVQREPAAASHRERLAMALLVAGDLEGALREQDLANDLQPTLLEGDRRLIQYLVMRGAHELALERAEALSARLSERPEPLLLQGQVHAARGAFADARAALSAVPIGTETRRSAARLLAQLARLDPIDEAPMPPTASPAPPAADAGPAPVGDPGLAQAKAILHDQVAADPADADSMALLAVLYADGADRAATEHWLRQAVAAGPARLDLRLLLARFLIDQARPAEAVTLLRADAETTPAHPELLLVYGTAQLAAGTLESAWQVARRAATASPDDFRALYLLARTEMALGQSATAVATLDRVLALAPALHLARRDLVAMLLASGDPARAATALAPLVSAMPGDAGVALLGGQVALAQDDLPRARDLLREAHAGGAGREALLALARTEARLDDLPAAMRLYRDWLARHPDDTGVRLALANALVVADDRSAAAVEWTQVLDTDPDNLLALNNLAYSLRETDPARGLDLAARAYAQAEDVAAIADTYATLQAASGDLRLAERTLARALDRHPDAHGLRLHRAELLLQDGRDEAARDQLAPLLRLPEDAPERARAAVLLAGLDSAADASAAAAQ